jgi:hypothetical protein
MTTSAPNPEVVLRPEPKVLSKTVSETDCKRALLSGPYGARKASHSNRMTIGLIGTYNLVDYAKTWMEQINEPIASVPKKELTDDSDKRRHKLLFPDFPGCLTAFEKSFVLETDFEQKITLSELRVLDRRNKVAYIEQLLQIIKQKLSLIVEASERKPDVIILLLSEEVYEACHIVGNYHRKLKRRQDEEETQLDLFKDFDTLQVTPRADSDEAIYRNLRSALKKLAMDPSYSVPIQIIRENTLLGRETQNLATRSWNLSTGLYYKAGDFPWILNSMDAKTCFLGISFYHKKTEYKDSVFSSMAHLFSNDFNSVVLRGDRVPFDEGLKSPVLDKEAAKNIIRKSLGEFYSARNRYPERLVIHKTSRYTPSEIDGFEEELSHLKIAYDLVSLTKAPIRLIRWGQYPVPRGAMYEFSEEDAYLYTKGFVPDLQTYPGNHVPSPFWVQKARGDSSMKTICDEILMLTKLNWNTADFCCGVPITLSFARNVGEVFKEFAESDEYEPSRFFRFYM